jgi:hypothetical protein
MIKCNQASVICAVGLATIGSPSNETLHNPINGSSLPSVNRQQKLAELREVPLVRLENADWIRSEEKIFIPKSFNSGRFMEENNREKRGTYTPVVGTYELQTDNKGNYSLTIEPILKDIGNVYRESFVVPKGYKAAIVLDSSTGYRFLSIYSEKRDSLGSEVVLNNEFYKEEKSLWRTSDSFRDYPDNYSGNGGFLQSRNTNGDINQDLVNRAIKYYFPKK